MAKTNQAFILVLLVGAFFAPTYANAQLLTVVQADVDLTTERLDYAGTFVDFIDTGSATNYEAPVGLANIDNGEFVFVAAPITTFNGIVLLEDKFEETVCGSEVELIVTSARLSTINDTLAVTARLCNFTCDVVLENYIAIFALDNLTTGEQSLQQVPLTSFSPEGCVEPPDTIVAIDIKPGSDPNCFNVNGHGVIPVAVLGSDTFDVTTIDVSSLLFGGLEVRVRGKKGPLCGLESVNGDAYLDLVCHFEDDADSWGPGDGEATLTGRLFDLTEFEGTDSICVVP